MYQPTTNYRSAGVRALLIDNGLILINRKMFPLSLPTPPKPHKKRIYPSIWISDRPRSRCSLGFLWLPGGGSPLLSVNGNRDWPERACVCTLKSLIWTNSLLCGVLVKYKGDISYKSSSSHLATQDAHNRLHMNVWNVIYNMGVI